MKDKHEHTYSIFKVTNVLADNIEYDRDKHGDWAFIVKVCECKDTKPVEFGPRRDMKEHLKVIMEKRNAVTT